MKPEYPPSGAVALMDELRAHPEWNDRQRDAVLQQLVARFPLDVLIATVLKRLRDLGGGDAEVIFRLIEAKPEKSLLRALALALAGQPDLAPERAWEALSILDDAGVLDEYPTLAERWEELNETLDDSGSIEELVEQIEGDREGIWLALQGLVAVEPEVRPEIVAGLSRARPGPGLIEFFRLLTYSHDEPTRNASLAALSAVEGDDANLRAAWLDLASFHPVPAIATLARRRLGLEEKTGLPALATQPAPILIRSLVTSIDGKGRGSIVLSSERGDERATAAFLCDVEQGLVEIVGEIEPESSQADAAFEEIVARVERDVVENAGHLACGLLAGSLLLSGPTSPPSWRFWVEATAGPLRPQPFRAEVLAQGSVENSPVEAAECTRLVLGACPDWLDASPLTFEMAEEIFLREGDTPPDPKRDSGAYRYLFEHRLQGRLETYRRMLLWMAGFWQASGQGELTGAAMELAAQLSDAQNVVPGHPFTVALTSRSLLAAQHDLRRGIDPRRSAGR